MLQFSRSSCLIGDERWKCEEKGLIDIYQFNSNLFIHFNGGSYRWTHHQSSSTPLSWIKSRHSSQITLQQAYSQRKCNMRSKIQWLTDFCSSHYISQFAAFFIDSRAKISIVKSYNKITPNQLLHFTQFPMLGSNKTATPISHTNDPSAGSPTETLLRLHLPLDDKIYTTSLQPRPREWLKIQSVHRIIQSVGATGGVG